MEGLIASALALLAALAPQARLDASTPWTVVWQRLDELAQVERSNPRFATIARELGTLAAERERAARARHDRPAALRARLLRAEVAALGGRPTRAIADPQTTLAFLPGEAWLAVRHLAPCTLRSEAIAPSIREAQGSARDQRVDWAERRIQEETDAGRIDLAAASARALDAEAHDSRSACVLAAALRLRGEIDSAEARLDAAWNSRPAAEDRVRLLEERAWLHQDGGPLEQRWAGAAIAAGSAACRWSVAESALAAGQRSRSQVVFRSLLYDDAYSERAWRGLGIASLSARAEDDGSSAPDAPESRNPQVEEN